MHSLTLMRGSHWLASLSIGLMLSSTAASSTVAAQDRTKPNIVIVYADDLGYGDVGCYNSASKVITAHLDRLATDGVRFTDAHSPSTVCTPSRYGIMTGRMPFRLNYRGVFTGVEGPCLITRDRLTLPELLQQEGYTTALFGKWHIGMSFPDHNGQPVHKTSNKRGVELVRQVDFTRPILDGPLNHGFDLFFGTVCCPTTDWLYAFIDGDRIPVPPFAIRDRDALPNHPWSFDCRAGLVAPDFDFEEVDMQFLDKSVAFLEAHASENKNEPFFLFHSAQAVHLPSFPGKAFQGKTSAGPHGDFIFEFDQVVGTLMETLDRLDLAENTLVIVTSDNGPEAPTAAHMRGEFNHDGARPWRGLKRDQWEGGHRVPFIARWPGKINAGQVCEATICQTDIMRTCAALLDIELPDSAAEDSFNLLPLFDDDPNNDEVRPYTIHQTMSLGLAIRQGPWKYLDHQGSAGNNYSRGLLRPYALPESAPDAPGQLYNLDDDPGETANLYDREPERVAALKSLLDSAVAAGRTHP